MHSVTTYSQLGATSEIELKRGWLRQLSACYSASVRASFGGRAKMTASRKWVRNQRFLPGIG